MKKRTFIVVAFILALVFLCHGAVFAKEILREGRQKGLIHTIMKFQKSFYAICSCCDCCCVPLRLSKKYGIGNALTRHEDIVDEFKKQLALHV